MCGSGPRVMQDLETLLKGTQLLESGVWGQRSGQPDFPLTRGGSGPAVDAALHAVFYFLQALAGF